MCWFLLDGFRAWSVGFKLDSEFEASKGFTSKIL